MKLRNGLPLLGGFLGALAAGSTWADYRWNFPDPATPLAADTLHVHNLFMLIITVIFVAVFAIMAYSMFVHRKSRGHEPATFTGPRSRVQWLWALVPFAILLFIDYIIFGIPAYHAVLTDADSRNGAQMVVKVTGLQWKWQYEYPEEGIKFVSAMSTPREQINNQAPKGENYLLEVDNPLVIPVGKKIRFITTSTDVIHSWWVPAFGVKRDAVPGFLREFWVRVDRPGVYRGQCAELCGKDHAFMPVVVHAVPEAEYLQWVGAQKTAMTAQADSAGREWTQAELMEKGKAVYEANCASCHQPGGEGIPGAFPALAGNKMMKAPALDPAGRLVRGGHLDRVMNGAPNTAMTAYKDVLNDAEIAAVVTYERNALGNKTGDLVQPAQVKALRGSKT
ncbi:MAG: cytochrome c oxidase subunit II [Betaproteobacteria bacterium]|nr:cytochrome c oxidase subunit II [Betaproteobacteria bacterium]